MRSTEVADIFISRHGDDVLLTNLSLNKLVYFAQVEFLRKYQMPLFSDPIEAWKYGPVEPAVYYAFRDFGRSRITKQASCDTMSGAASTEQIEIVDEVAKKYGSLTAFDLVNISHRDGGAWKKKYVAGQNVEITVEDILESIDYREGMNAKNTLSEGIMFAQKKWPNALHMLEDA